MKSHKTHSSKTRPVRLDEVQSAMAIFAAALGVNPRYLPTDQARKFRNRMKHTALFVVQKKGPS